ncbi:unnamed protein product, partial [Urochloa humidicola]
HRVDRANPSLIPPSKKKKKKKRDARGASAAAAAVAPAAPRDVATRHGGEQAGGGGRAALRSGAGAGHLHPADLPSSGSLLHPFSPPCLLFESCLAKRSGDTVPFLCFSR